MNPKLLTIIVTYNGIRWIDRCIDSVIGSSVHSDIIVIDNGSTDGTQERIRERWNEVLLIQSDENLGFGRANNIGFDHALSKLTINLKKKAEQQCLVLEKICLIPTILITH